MAAELDKEAKSDQELYDKLACWCETNDKDKTKAISDGNDKSASLTASIEKNTALASTRETEIAALTEEAAALTKALGEAKAIREKQNDEFNMTEKDLIQSIHSLKNAVMQLGKTQGEQPAEELLQKQENSLLQVANTLRSIPKMALHAVPPHMRPQLRELLQAPREGLSLLQQPPPGGASNYEPQSGAIFGVLKQMKETFETNMEEGKKEEAESAAQYEELKRTKETQLNAANEKIFRKGQELAKARETAANDKEDLDDTQVTLEADTEFLAKLKEQCATIDKQWEERSKMRSEEIATVDEAIDILTHDDSRDQFNAAGTFMQLRAQSRRQARARGVTAEHLAAAGDRLKSSRLSYLAVRVKNDVFAKIQQSIDGMVVQLDTEQHNEAGKKDGCIKDEDTNEKQTIERTDHKDDVETEINALEADIEFQRQDQARLKSEIAEAHIAQKRASEDRLAENKQFQQVVTDQQATQKILLQAKDRLAQFYAKKTTLVQTRAKSLEKVAQQPPVAFNPYKKHSSSKGAMALLQNIIEESLKTEKEALAAENAAQAAYEGFLVTSFEEIKAMFNQIQNDQEIEAQDAKREALDSVDKRATISDILKLGEVSQTLHEACDFTVNNFGERQSKRSEEMEALKQSKAIFAGMEGLR